MCFGVRHVLFDRGEAVRGHRDRVNSGGHQELGEGGIVAGALATKAYGASDRVGASDQRADAASDGRVGLIEDAGKDLGVAVDAEGQLGQVVTADRKTVEALREVLGEDDVGRDLGHDVDLQALPAAYEPLLHHRVEDTVRLAECGKRES